MPAVPEDRADPGVDLRMGCTSLDGVPACELPVGYTLRGYRDGDDVVWARIQGEADRFNVIDAGLFRRQYGQALGALPDRMWFVEDADGEAVGTISNWWEHGPDHPNDRGRIHWVAVKPAHQRRGIARAMMSRALREMARHHEQAMLSTSSARPWALKLYLDFAFLPESSDLENEARLEAWRAAQAIIRHPRLAAVLATIRT